MGREGETSLCISKGNFPDECSMETSKNAIFFSIYSAYFDVYNLTTYIGMRFLTPNT